MANQKFQPKTSLKRAGIAAVLSLAGLLGACDAFNNQAADPQQTLSDPDETEGVTTVTSLEEVIEDTDQLLGRTVTVTGYVDEMLGPGIYLLEDQNTLLGEDTALVITVNEPPQEIVADQTVQITGEVRQFVAAEFEEDYDLTWDLDLKRKIEAEYEGKPVIFSQVTRVIQE
ncbi:MAG: hypothetical protein ACP5D7_11895 [Limnospira sp.]